MTHDVDEVRLIALQNAMRLEGVWDAIPLRPAASYTHARSHPSSPAPFFTIIALIHSFDALTSAPDRSRSHWRQA